MRDDGPVVRSHTSKPVFTVVVTALEYLEEDGEAKNYLLSIKTFDLITTLAHARRLEIEASKPRNAGIHRRRENVPGDTPQERSTFQLHEPLSGLIRTHVHKDKKLDA